jgi:hypothetical protein
MDHVVDISPSGSVRYLEKPQFDLSVLGDRRIKRATDITFEEATQKWDVVLCGRESSPHPIHSMGFDDYETARQFEVKWLNFCMLSQCDPLDHVGFFNARMACNALNIYRPR